MPERPLVLFASPTTADKEKKHGGSLKYSKPSYDRQMTRISPKFAVLQHKLEQGNVTITSIANAVEPEYTLVFESIGDPSGFYTAVCNLKKKYPNIEWVMELSSSCPNDEDFYALDKRGTRDDSKLLPSKIFCVLTNQEALSQILSLWNNYKSNKNFKFDHGLAGFRHLFDQLKDVHLWGTQERIEDTGLIDEWKSCLLNSKDSVRAQIELFFRSSSNKRSIAEQKVEGLIESAGGKVVCKSLIPEIRYHALLAEFPGQFAQNVLNKEEVCIVTADEIMFMKGVGQTVAIETVEDADETTTLSTPVSIIDNPIIGLFDGMPQENHPLLRNLLVVDDPEDYGQNYPVNERIHCTSMASLVLRGQNMSAINEEVHKVYVRPIMKSKKDFHGRVDEYIPDAFLLVDKVHECIRRLFESGAGRVAPSVRIINLSIGISYREYYNSISPLARLLDWLSMKYRVLFIVSAGNHTDDIQLETPFRDYAANDSAEKDKFVYKYISDNLRKLRLLSPAESMNALTVGALFLDDNDAIIPPNLTNLCSDGLPAVYSSFGRGINNAIKPDILYHGGRSLVKGCVTEQNSAQWVVSNTRKPGIQSAYPGAEKAGIGSVGYSFGTSNSTALITNKAAECYDVINQVFVNETGNIIPYDHAAVLVKGLLAHGASWADLKETCIQSLNLSGNQTKNRLHSFLGYGATDIDKVKECAKNQITLIGYGDILQGNAFEYSIPLPFNFYSKRYKRKLTVTLAYFSSICPSILKYREKQVWFTLNNGKDIVGSRSEYDDKAVVRGTLQHEVFETDSIGVWNEDESLTIKVNCRADASEANNTPVPYALFATFELAPEYDIDVYQAVLERVRIKGTIMPNVY